MRRRWRRPSAVSSLDDGFLSEPVLLGTFPVNEEEAFRARMLWKLLLPAARRATDAQTGGRGVRDLQRRLAEVVPVHPLLLPQRGAPAVPSTGPHRRFSTVDDEILALQRASVAGFSQEGSGETSALPDSVDGLVRPAEPGPEDCCVRAQPPNTDLRTQHIPPPVRVGAEMTALLMKMRFTTRVESHPVGR